MVCVHRVDDADRPYSMADTTFSECDHRHRG